MGREALFLLNNIDDRKYAKIYPDFPGVVFDLNDEQLARPKNAAWTAITQNSIVCVVNSSRKVSTFYRIDNTLRATPNDGSGEQSVIVGRVAAKIEPYSMPALLNKFNVKHQHLSAHNQFTIGFNVADLGNQLDALEVFVNKMPVRLGSL